MKNLLILWSMTLFMLLNPLSSYSQIDKENEGLLSSATNLNNIGNIDLNGIKWDLSYPNQPIAIPCEASSNITGPTKIIRTNWPSEYMNKHTNHIYLYDWVNGNMQIRPKKLPRYHSYSYNCIQRNTSGIIQIGLSYIVCDIDYLENSPPVYIQYTVGNDIGIAHPQYIGAGAANVGSVYWETVTINLSDMTTPNSIYDHGLGEAPAYTFDCLFELVTPNAAGTAYIPYPTVDYPNLFVESNALSDSGNDPRVLEINKYMCPPDGNGSGLAIEEELPTAISHNTPLTIETNTISDATASTETSSLSKTIAQPITITTFPNPFQEELTIEGAGGEALALTMWNVNGQLIYSEKITTFDGSFTKTIDTTTFAKGIYVCHVQTEKTVHLLKVVKH